MPRVALSDQERRTLNALVAHLPIGLYGTVPRRCCGFIRGASVIEVARRLGVYRHTIYR